MNRARLIEERRLGRERDIESVEKAIMRNTGMKLGAPKLRNISQIRETIFVDQPLTTIDKMDRAESRNRPHSVGLGLEDGNVKIPRTHSSLLADLKDLERLRNTPPTQRNQRVSLQRNQRPDSRSAISNKKNDAPASVKIRSDIFRIQQMFHSTDPAPRTVMRNGHQDTKIRSDSEKEERKPGTELNRTRLLAQKLLEASRGNRDFLKDRSNNSKNAPGKASSKDAKEGKALSKILQETHRIPEESWNKMGHQERKEPNLGERPCPPARRRRDSRHRGWKDADRGEDPCRSEGLHCPAGENSPNGGAGMDENSKASANLERPDILDGLLKESDRQLANLKNDLGERGRSRSHWRGFVQSMRLHDVELHSDGEDQRKGEFASSCFARENVSFGEMISRRRERLLINRSR